MMLLANQPQVDIIQRLILENEFRKKDRGSYSYPSGSGMCHECHNCGVKSFDDDDIPHKDGCITKTQQGMARVNDIQLKMLMDWVVDAFEIRRMLFISNCKEENQFTEFGEMQDLSNKIDYLRDNASAIKVKLTNHQ